MNEKCSGNGLSIIISCFNEEESIVELLSRISASVPNAEIILVHGGTDRTGELARQMAGRIPDLKIIHNKNDRGKGHGVKVGIEAATHDLMLNIDADLQFDPEEIPLLVEPLLRGVHLVHGSRYQWAQTHKHENEAHVRSLGNWVLSQYASLLTGRRITDVNAGFISWTRDFMNHCPFEDDRYCWEAEWIVKCARVKKKFLEIPVTFRPREAGASMHASTFAVMKGGVRFFCWLTKAYWGS